MSPFDFVNSINKHEYDFDATRANEYSPYLTNIAFSLHGDTLQAANMMNRYPELSNLMQYDFYFHVVKPRKRYSPNWPKKRISDDILLIMDLYKYSYTKAKDIVEILSDNELEIIRNQK